MLPNYVTGYVYQDHGHPLVQSLKIVQNAADELATLAQRERRQGERHVPQSWIDADQAERIRFYLAKQVQQTDACWINGFNSGFNSAAQEVK